MTTTTGTTTTGTTTTRMAAYVGDGVVTVTDGAVRAPARGEVRLEVAYTGICGTDLHIVHGAMDARVQRPLVFGHEASAVVAELGEGVGELVVGQRVVVVPLVWDGTCPACLAGHQHVCQNLTFVGIDSPGALQESWTVPAGTVVPLPDSLSLHDAALTEPVAVAVHDVRRSGLRGGERVVVLGAGPIGVLISTVARTAGAEVVVVELDEQRRARAADLGFRTLDPRDDLERLVEEWTGGAGADVVFEVSGAAAAVAVAPRLARVRGTLVVVAIHPTPREVDLQRVFWRELTLVGARVYERRDVEEAIDLLTRGIVPVDRIVSSVRPLAQTAQAVEELAAGRGLKVLIQVGRSQ
ncbi:zinc-dependent alcohol dehydrogenase [Kineococcus sp. SYSU DK002]|uniref:zinc-dependent alcohol dehydrogenase n=1 Tax=Kineococcus sp. SYSU DK002 TaxID=3383123 RepID=UPI003D7D97A2